MFPQVKAKWTELLIKIYEIIIYFQRRNQKSLDLPRREHLIQDSYVHNLPPIKTGHGAGGKIGKSKTTREEKVNLRTDFKMRLLLSCYSYIEYKTRISASFHLSGIR